MPQRRDEGRECDVVENEAGQPMAHDYAKFPREFASYRWYKPLLVGLLGVVFTILFMVAVAIVASVWAGDLDFIDRAIGDSAITYTGPGAFFGLGEVAILLPALALAALVVRDRPFSSYSSSRGGFMWSAFAKCACVALVIYAVDFVVENVVFGELGEINPLFTPSGLAMCILLVPVQCFAEEYVFRGFVLQTVGAWTRLPVAGIIVSAIVFTVGHVYNAIGLVGIFFNGIVWGYIVWKTAGLEATCALHVVNNAATFLVEGLGLVPQTTEINVASLVAVIVIDIVYLAVVLIANRKLGWFSPKR